MKIAVINETSAAEKNSAIMDALLERGHTIINVGMTENGAIPELSYIHTGLLSAILLNRSESTLWSVVVEQVRAILIQPCNSGCLNFNTRY